MSERNRTLDNQLKYGLCGASELVRRIASVLGRPCFDGKSPTGSRPYFKQAVGHGFAHFREQINGYGQTNVALV